MKRILKKIFRIAIKVLIGLVVLVFCALIIVRIGGWLNFRQADEKILNILRDADTDTVFIDTAYWSHGPITYAGVEKRDSVRQKIVFVHGCPGSLDAFLHLMQKSELLRMADMYSYDRPGYGGSSFGEAYPLIDDQVSALKAVIDSIGGKAVLVGHSLGGPIIAQFAVDHPDQVEGLMIIAGSLDPGMEGALWWRKLLVFTGFEHLMPVSFCICNREILPLKEELTGLRLDWPDIFARTIVIHGMNDRLVPIENADFVESNMTGANNPEIIRVKDEDHLLLWTSDELVTTHLLRLLKVVKGG